MRDDSVWGKLAKRVKDTADNASKGAEDIGAGLAEKQKTIDSLKSTDAPAKAAPTGEPAGPKGTGKYGDRPGEKRLDWAMDPKTPVYHKGVASVPKTGPAILKKGEKVVKAEDNPDNPENKEEKSEKSDNPVEEAMEHSPAEKAHFHRAMSHLHKGGLHRHFGIAEDKPIPMEKKQEAANSDNPHTAAMGRLAVAMHGWKK